MILNLAQRTVLMLAITAFGLSGAFVPWEADRFVEYQKRERVTRHIGYFPIWWPPREASRIVYSQVLFTWGLIAVMGAGLFFLASARRDPP